MKGGYSYIKAGKKKSKCSKHKTQQPYGRAIDEVLGIIFRRLHKLHKGSRYNQRYRETVYQYAYSALKQVGAKFIRPFGIQQLRKGRELIAP
ncbi:hypothetical protein SDC9_188449 [bioreactor metagenome]|uniref:Uncharacterized protein n=1 Tax=bioreactor metagenome TaxID=1076179 RepID=A0A645HRR9_9ZZZZ